MRIAGRIRECANLIDEGERLPDVGCGAGWLAQVVLARGFREYVGVDRAPQVDAQQAPAGASFVEGSVFNLPFVEGSFDACCLFDVIEHVPRGREGEALTEVGRVLRPGGKLYFSTPHASAIHTPLDPTWWVLGHRHYRKAKVQKLLQSAGFSLDRMFVAGGLIECLDYIRLLFYMHALHRPMPDIRVVSELVEQSHGVEKSLGMTVFVVASRGAGG